MIKKYRSILLIFCCILVSDLFPQATGQDAWITTADSLLEAGQYEKAISKYQEYIDSQGKIGESRKKIISDCYVSVGLCYYKLNEFENAITWFLKALDLQNDIGDREAAANTLNNIGLSYKKLGDYDKAIEYYEKTVKLDEEDGKAGEMAKTYNNIGMIYRARGKYDKAIEYFEKSLGIKKSLDDQAGISKSLNNMGLVYTEWKKYDDAILMFRESLSIEESLKNESEAAIRLNNLGRAYFYKNQYDTALAYFEQFLDFQLMNNNKDQIALAYNNIGKIYLARDQFNDAASYLSSALALFSELGMESEKATVLANLGNISQAMGNSAKALHLLDSSTVIADRLNLRYQLQQNYLYFSDIYSSLKDYKKSLEYYKKYTAVKDSIFSKEILSQLSDFQAKYEKEKDQAHILALEKENLQRTNERNTYLFIGLGIFVLAIFSVVYFRQRAVQIRMIADQKIRRLEEEKKLMAARLLVEGQEKERKRIATELHDGLGVLLSATRLQFSIISDKSPENKALIDKASRLLEQATGDVRKISHNMMPGLLTKLGVFDAIEDIFDQVNETQDLNAVCTISGEQLRLPENKEIMLYRVVQEMVNNSLKHAGAKNLQMKIDINPHHLDLVYQDDGKGFDPDEKLISESIGLQSIQSRVNFLNGKMDIDSSPGHGVKYTMQIPI